MNSSFPENVQPLSSAANSWLASLLRSRMHIDTRIPAQSSPRSSAMPPPAYAVRTEPQTQELPMTEELLRRLREAGL